MVKSKITEEDKQSQFLKWIYGDNIPNDLEKEVYPDGSVVYSHGKPNPRLLVEAALKIMNS